MLLFKTLIRRCHTLMRSLARAPAPADTESARERVQALRQLAAQAERLEAQLRQLIEARARQQRRPVQAQVPPESPDSTRQR